MGDLRAIDVFVKIACDFCFGHGRSEVLFDQDRFEGVGYTLVVLACRGGILVYFEFSGPCLCSLFYRRMKPVVFGTGPCRMSYSGEIFVPGVKALDLSGFYMGI